MSEQAILFGGPQDGREILLQGQPQLIFIPIKSFRPILAEDHSKLEKTPKYIYKRTFEDDSKGRRIYNFEGRS